MFKLVKPTLKWESKFYAYLDEWLDRGDKLIPHVENARKLDYEKWLYDEVIKRRDPKTCKRTVIPAHIFFFVKETPGERIGEIREELLGMIEVRHNLSAKTVYTSGHIEYGIRPSQRGKGYGKHIIAATLSVSQSLGLKKVLFCVDAANEASRRLIRGAGGIYVDSSRQKGAVVERYYIYFDLKEIPDGILPTPPPLKEPLRTAGTSQEYQTANVQSNQTGQQSQYSQHSQSMPQPYGQPVQPIPQPQPIQPAIPQPQAYAQSIPQQEYSQPAAPVAPQVPTVPQLPQQQYAPAQPTEPQQPTEIYQPIAPVAPAAPQLPPQPVIEPQSAQSEQPQTLQPEQMVQQPIIQPETYSPALVPAAEEVLAVEEVSEAPSVENSEKKLSKLEEIKARLLEKKKQ